MLCVIDHKKTRIEYRAGCLRIHRPGRKNQVRSVALNQLDQVVVYGNPVAETAVWRYLAEAGIPVLMLASRGRPQVAMSGPGLAVRLPLRRLQHRLADRPPACLIMARWFIREKIQGYRQPLVTLSRRFKADAGALARFEDQCGQAASQLDHAESVAEVMGIEGRLAHGWFRLLARSLPTRLRFRDRNRRPPRDPVNALLSLAYTLLLSEVRQVLLIEGFDPSLGFLHQEYPGREALALDFLEIFRCGVDHFILNWLADTTLDKASFYYRKEEGCRLARKTRPLFYQAWATHREEWPRPVKTGNGFRRTPLREVILGCTARARELMASLQDGDGDEINPA